MTPALIIALISLGLSLISTGIAVASFRRTRQIQNFDYATRLQLEDESILGSGYGPDDAFCYSANLVNLGLKPIQVDHVFVDYGGELEKTYFKFQVEGRFHLPPGGKRAILFSLAQKDYEEVRKRFSLEQCLFRLRVCFLNATGGTVETTRKLLSVGPGKVTMYAQPGDAIT